MPTKSGHGWPLSVDLTQTPQERDAMHMQRYGFIVRTAVLHTRCGCTRRMELNVDHKGPPPALGAPLDPLPPLAWMADDPREVTQTNERLFERRQDDGTDSEGRPLLHYQEVADAYTKHLELSNIVGDGKARQIFLPDEETAK